MSLAASWPVRKVLSGYVETEGTFNLSLLESPKLTGNYLDFNTLANSKKAGQQYYVLTNAGDSAWEVIEFIRLHGRTLTLEFTETGARELSCPKTLTLTFEMDEQNFREAAQSVNTFCRHAGLGLK